MQKFENTLKDSPHKILYVYPTTSFGMGPRIVTQSENLEMHDFPRHQIAQFLNTATGKDLQSRTISEETESQILIQFHNVLVLDSNNKYKYTGPEFILQEKLTSTITKPKYPKPRSYSKTSIRTNHATI